jgi:tripartite-type tricarboxylate transporter receptor subunit TctC
MKTWKMLSLAVLAAALAMPALAAPFPQKPITVIVPFPPGGASDNSARFLESKMSEILGQPVVVENRPGANGATGAGMVKQAAADGYTLLVGSIGVFSINSALFPELGYSPQKDFDLLSVIIRYPNVLVTRPDFPANNVAELIDYLKKNPKKVTFPSSGNGSSDHLTAELFWQRTGTSGIHVPYKGGGPAHADIMGGHADVSFQNLGSVSSYVKAGKMKILGVTAEKRHPVFPDVPTMAEAGVKDLVVYSWQAAAAPKGLPADVKAKLSDALIKAAKDPQVSKRFTELGYDVVASTPAEFDKFQAEEQARWTEVVKTANIKVQ